MKQDELELGGELVVSGQDSVSIKLKPEYPTAVMCRFVDDVKVQPTCNPPPIEDVLRYSIQHRNGHFHLNIGWNIYSGTREIHWNAKY
jgi:hypothetical protein